MKIARPMTVFFACVAVLSASPTPLAAQRSKQPASSKSKPGESALVEPIRARVDAILASLEEPKADAEAAKRQAFEVLDWVLAYADPDRDAAAYRVAAIGSNVASLLTRASKKDLSDLAGVMRACPTFAARVAFITNPDAKDHTPDKLCAMIARLASDLGPDAPKTIESYADLAAAICVVHDRPLVRVVNENRVTPADGVDLFNYFLKHEKGLAFGLKNVPVGLLVYVVDAAASIEELEWAFSQFSKSKNIEQLYGQISYDHEHVITGRPKTVTEKGFSLQNIKQWGGVCVDQAYFTSEVAKALGVPATVVTGRDVTIGHAWLGIFKAPKNNPGWDFNTGRYESYQKVRGNVIDPVSGALIPDGVLDVLADSFAQPASKREESYALAFAGQRLEAIGRSGAKSPYPPKTDVIEGAKPDAPARPATAAEALKILRQAVEQSPSSLDAWWAVRSLAQLGSLTMEDRREWTSAVERLCGKKYPDFTWMMLEPMISSIDDPKVQDPMWDRAMNLFQARPDLASMVRFAEAGNWIKRDKPGEAYKAFQDVVDKYASDSPMAVAALAASRKILEQNKKSAQVLPMYENAWKKLKAPDFEVTSEFRRQSNWFRVGAAYAAVLAESGKGPESKAILSQIGATR